MRKGFFEFKTEDDVLEIQIPDRTGKPLRIKCTGGITPKGGSPKNTFRKRKVVWGRVSKGKIMLIEQLEFSDRNEVRLGYRTTTHKTGRWCWGESALIVSASDLKELWRYAEENGVLNDGSGGRA